jgi:hypothetical protein
VRTAKNLRNKDPGLAAAVGKGDISLNAATEVAKMPPGTDRQQTIVEVKESASKTKAKRVVARSKGKKNTSQKESGKIARDPLAEGYAGLLTVLERLPGLTQELRRFEKGAPRGMSAIMAFKLKSAMTGLSKIDFGELRTVAGSAANVLDLFIRRSKDNAE